MALNGTLKDFGIADILQLIGQQQKTGLLRLKNKAEEVTVTFKDGNILGAAAVARSKHDLIGAMLVRANLISEQQLEFALENQKRTLQRLGDVLVAQGLITQDKFKAMMQLQASETLFKLFGWKAGNYSFEQKDIDEEPIFTPLRAESVLMEGFRRVDEWPVVKKRITSPAMTFEKIKELPPPPLKRDEFDSALDDAFAEDKKEVSQGEFQSVGENERKVYELIKPGRTAEQIIDQSCLGEFEASKALCNLINLEYAKGNAPTGKVRVEGQPGFLARLGGLVGRVAVSVLVVGVLFVLFTRVDLGSVRLAGSGTRYTDPAAQRIASQQQMARIGAALELYRLEHGGLPTVLTDLEESGLLSADDLRYPWRDNYYYRAQEGGQYVLLPPLR